MNVHTIRIATLVLFLGLPAGLLQAAEHRMPVSERIEAAAGVPLSFENLAGAITLAPGGDAFVIEGEVIARARNAAEAEALAQSVRLQKAAHAEGHEVWMAYPTSEHSTFRYGNRGSNTTTTYRGERVSVRGRGRGAEVHADLTILVPEGMTVSVKNVVGTLTASGLAGEVTLRTASGRIESTGGRDGLMLRAGSGRIEVAGHDGALEARTGSGRITAADVNGPVDARAGSGDIRLARVRGETLQVRTGSGGIRIEDGSGSLRARTGSGGMRVAGFVAGPEVDTTSGSGSMRIEGDLGAVTRLNMSAGSGSIRVESSTMPNLALRASAGSGRVTVEAPGAQVEQDRRNRARATLGDGSGEGRISTGSGSIQFRVGD